MKETQLQPKDQTEMVKQSVQEKKTKLLGRVVPHIGHSLFEYNAITNELRFATFEVQEDTLSFAEAKAGKKAIKRKKVLMQEGCVYTTALNIKNAIKQFKKLLQRDISPIIIK